jgi:hypothetical protein
LNLRALVALLVAFTSVACASFRGGEVPPTQPWPPAAAGAAKKSVSMILASGSTEVNGKTVDAPPNMVANWQQWTEATYRDSALFSAVVDPTFPSDLRSEVRVVDTGNANPALAFISGLTLTLLPAKASDRVTLHTEFKNAKGELLATIEKSESLDTWIQLFLVFAMPFHLPKSEVRELFAELNRATLAEAHAQGII